MKHLTQLAFTIVAAAGASLLIGVPGANAQSSDAIIDKLVEKGILTADEATELRAEADQGFDESFRAKTGMSDVITGFDFKGDFRGRYEGFYKDSPNFTDRHRWRYRVRLGVTLDLVDQFEFGFQLGSGDLNGLSSLGGIDPISNNQSLGNNASKKGIFVDLVYATWHPLNGPDWEASTTIGKMKNPFVTSDLMFDHDYTPEGVSQTFSYHVNEGHTLGANLGAFVLNEVGGSSRDPYMFGGQARWNSKWTDVVRSSLGFGAFSVINRDRLGNADVPNINIGNERVPGATVPANATPLYAFNTVVADGQFTYVVEDGVPLYRAKFPISIIGDYVHNLSAADHNSGYSIGVKFGKSGKKGLWDVSYRWKYLEANAWYEEFLDSDTGAYYPAGYSNSGQGSGFRAGTNTKGHLVKLQYSPFDVLTFGVTGFFTEAVNPVPGVDDSTIIRVQADAQFKF